MKNLKTYSVSYEEVNQGVNKLISKKLKFSFSEKWHNLPHDY